MTMSSRRPPWPFHALLNVGDGNKGLLLATDQRGVALIGKKLKSLDNVIPTTAEYGNDDLYRERSFAMKRLVLGLGERVQSGAPPQRYRYARNCWFAGGLRGKGPQWHNLSPATTGGIVDFAEALKGGTLTQFILAGRYVLERGGDTSGTQTVSKDFGVGRTATSWVRFKEPSGTDRLLVTLDNGEFWVWDGSVWPGSVGSITAYYATVVRDELWIKSSANGVRKCTANPTVAANYAAEITVGDGSRTITGLASVESTLLIFLSDGNVATLNSDGTENFLASDLATTPAATNGSKPAVWVHPRNGLAAAYFRNASSWWRMTVQGGAAAEPVGPERLIENDSPVSGVAQVFAGYSTFYGFYGIYNTSSGTSYLLQFGDWIPRGNDEDGFGYVETFNGALVEWPSRQVSAMRVSSVSGVPRLYVGFTDGTFGWITLPSNTPNPFSATSGCEFADGTTGPSVCYWPTHKLAEVDEKAGLSFAAFGPVLDTTRYVTVGYALDGAAAYTDQSSPLVSGGVANALPDTTVYRAMDVRETYTSPSSASTPVVESVVLREQLRPATRLEYQMTVKAGWRQALRNGASDRRTPEQIHALVKAAADNPAAVTLTLPDEVVQRMTAVDYGEHLRLPGRAPGGAYGTAWDLPVSFLQFLTTGTYGTIDRLGDLTVDGLGSMTIDDLGVL